MLEVCLTIDVEPDCPPYLATQYRGVEEGLPRLLDLLAALSVPTTCFCTGQVAERYPHRIADLVKRGHELGCHGHTHSRFDRLTEAAARAEIATATPILRSFGVEVTSFRAPNLRFPDEYLPLLEERSFTHDSSQGKYKSDYFRRSVETPLTRIPASITSSALRLPRWIRDPWLLALSSPIVLFVHPWEFVDLTRERLRLDCRFRTGAPALRALREVVEHFRSRGAVFRKIRDL
jgi:peptidoglycan/xylan/chitin deacetylase (PgdA/CDA1 family)